MPRSDPWSIRCCPGSNPATWGSPTATSARPGSSSGSGPVAGASWSVSTGRRCVGRRQRPAWSKVGRVATGFVQQQTIRVTEVDGDGVMQLRRIRLQLDQPTRDKETELFLLTDLPPEHADALLVAETYRRRWALENVFQSLTEALSCEIDTLAYPKAALFGFCVALVA